jgi:hypothetical protein
MAAVGDIMVGVAGAIGVVMATLSPTIMVMDTTHTIMATTTTTTTQALIPLIIMDEDNREAKISLFFLSLEKQGELQSRIHGWQPLHSKWAPI